MAKKKLPKYTSEDPTWSSMWESSWEGIKAVPMGTLTLNGGAPIGEITSIEEVEDENGKKSMIANGYIYQKFFPEGGEPSKLSGLSLNF